MEFAEKIRKAKGHRSYAEIARHVGCSPENIRKIMDQGAQPRFVLGVKIAELLGVSAHWLANERTGWPPLAPDSSADPRGSNGTDPQEEGLLRLFRRLEPDQRARAIGILEGITLMAGDGHDAGGDGRD
jgi:hypothetical protein